VDGMRIVHIYILP